MEHIWINGKTGWYIAAWVWDQKLAAHWMRLGYQVSSTGPIVN